MTLTAAVRGISTRTLSSFLVPLAHRGSRCSPLPRYLSQTPITCASAKGPHPERHGKKAKLTEGVAEHAKEDPSKVTGVPQEPSTGPPPPPLAGRSTPDLFNLSGRTVIVTGGARGLGLTVAQALLECDANVAAVDLLPEPSEQEWPAAREIAEAKGLKLTYDQLDITNQEQVKSTFHRLFSSASSSAPVRGLFHAAGIQLLMPALNYTADQVRKIIDVNTTGSFLVSQAFAREFIERNKHLAVGAAEVLDGPGSHADGMNRLAGDQGASIVLTASMSGHVANYGLECAAYNASKAAVHTMAKCFAMEWSKKGIRINTLSPGYIRTAMTAALLEQRPDFNETWLKGSLLGRLSTQDEFRGPAIYLLSDASSFMTGADLLVDGGHTAT
ncbi:hypothetical protein BD324DRAFT_683497 [Kockovaella imperatae]|uniref:Ketoreductase domain-containing protein n=1 Tax=Kockovaella imperatae TaxID=4999 RepID=A0A1Y1U952_9TREE|nr:hypothetical protein BD324DRAFT_683497 [Kockovaella imperatae]ORX34558.1 hypothetical protein BD324DRAFT_683497 [Kockovaella imperatae]